MSQNQVELDIINDRRVNKEVKLNLILEMLSLKEISLKTSQKLCKEAGLITKDLDSLDKETIQTHNEFYRKQKNPSQ